MSERRVKFGEPLAMASEALQQGPDAFFWLFGPAVKSNYFCGDIAVVTISGPLEHHACPDGDSYESIVARVRAAYCGSEDGDNDADDQHGPASAVVLRVDSPGGVVAGLTETIRALKSIRAEYNKPLIAYVDEMAASAAYAICCACDEVLVPSSAITGSVGVISTMVDQTARDKMDGLKFVTITSGARKADGHPHVPISNGAISAETGRVEKLALQFYKQVRSARGLSVSKVQSYQAGIFLGMEGVRAGLADGVMGWDEAIEYLGEKISLASSMLGGTTSGTRSGTRGTSAARKETDMSITLTALVSKTEKALKAETDPTKRAALSAVLEAYKKTKHTIEKHESEEGGEEDEEDEAEEGGNETDRSDEPENDDEDDDKDEDSDEDEKSEEKKSKKSAKAPMEDKCEDEEEEESAKAVLALAQSATGKKGRAAIGALAAQLAAGTRALEVSEKIQRERTAEKKASMIDAALSKRRITRHEAKELRGKPMSFVKPFLDMRPKAIIVTDDENLHIPSADPKNGDALPADVEKSIAAAMVSYSDKNAEEKARIRTALVDAHTKRMNGASNGVVRY